MRTVTKEHIKIGNHCSYKCNLWLKQRLTPRKTAPIMTVVEQMVETRGWKMARRLIKMEDVDYVVNSMKPLSTFLLDVRR